MVIISTETKLCTDHLSSSTQAKEVTEINKEKSKIILLLSKNIFITKYDIIILFELHIVLHTVLYYSTRFVPGIISTLDDENQQIVKLFCDQNGIRTLNVNVTPNTFNAFQFQFFREFPVFPKT